MRRSAVAALLALGMLALAVFTLAGCQVTSQDDETSSPTPAAPSSSAVQPAPTTLPVGHGDVGPDDVVWAQGGVLHVGARQWDLSPLDVTSFVVVPGGVFFLSDGELWLTDLVRARAAGITAATRLATTADGAAVRVTSGNPATTRAWDTTTGHAVPLAEATVSAPAGPSGPGAFDLVGGAGDALRAVRSATGQRVPLRGVVGDGFRLVRWTTGTTFYGLALDQGRPSAVLSCDLAAGTCRTWGRPAPDQPVVFEGSG